MVVWDHCGSTVDSDSTGHFCFALLTIFATSILSRTHDLGVCPVDAASMHHIITCGLWVSAGGLTMGYPVGHVRKVDVLSWDSFGITLISPADCILAFWYFVTIF